MLTCIEGAVVERGNEGLVSQDGSGRPRGCLRPVRSIVDDVFLWLTDCGHLVRMVVVIGPRRMHVGTRERALADLVGRLVPNGRDTWSIGAAVRAGLVVGRVVGVVAVLDGVGRGEQAEAAARGSRLWSLADLLDGSQASPVYRIWNPKAASARTRAD